jgi:hypothetical protein
MGQLARQQLQVVVMGDRRGAEHESDAEPAEGPE